MFIILVLFYFREECGKGGLALAEQVLAVLEEENNFSPLYDVTESIEEKARTIVQKVYGGKDVQFTDQAKKQMAQIEKFGWDSLPICMAKTQYSLSDQPSLLGRLEGFTITIREVIPRLLCLSNKGYCGNARTTKSSSCITHECR